MGTLERLFEPVIGFMVNKADACLSEATPKWEPLLKAYNTMRSDKYAHNGYIYDTNLNDDVIALLKSNFSFSDIVEATSDELPFVIIEEVECGRDILRGINGENMLTILKSNLREVMECVVEYGPYCADYLEIYKQYVSCEFAS